MSAYQEETSDSQLSKKFSVTFPEAPPVKIAVIPREFLYPFWLVMTVVALIILITTKFLVSVIILAVLAGICYAGYKKFNKENLEFQKGIEESFFLPFGEQLNQQGIKLSRTKIAYLWNYNSAVAFSAPFKFSRVSLINNWNSNAVIGIEENVKLMDLLPK